MSLLSRLRRPEYTGENRCWPCTLVNAAIVLVVGAALTLLSPLLGLIALVGGAGLIVLRGYVVPYTPEFAPRLVRRLPVDLGFSAEKPQRADGGHTSESLVGDEAVDGDELIRHLMEAGVVTADESGDLFLDDDLRRTWEAGMARLRDVSEEELASATASAAPFPAEGRIDGDWVVVERVSADGAVPGAAGDEVWLSRAHAVSDTAAVAAMSDRVDAATAAQAATPVRLFLQQCPVCGGGVEETVARECCGGTKGIYDNPETPILACADCGEPLYEF